MNAFRALWDAGGGALDGMIAAWKTDPDAFPGGARVLGDGCVLVRRFEQAAAIYEDGADLSRLLTLCAGWGRYRAVKAVRERVPDAMSEAAWVDFLRGRALEALPWRREHGVVVVDAGVLADIAAELGEDPRSLAAETARRLFAGGYRNDGKLRALMTAAGGPVDGAIVARERRPIAPAVERRGGRIVRVVQAPDDDADDPKVAYVAIAEVDGRRVVVKEHLRLPIDGSRADGYGDEAAILRAIAGPNVARLLDVWPIEGGSEVLVLEFAPGRPLCRLDVRTVGALAGALARMHAVGVLYLDMKPENVLVDGATPTIVDFAMSQRLRPGEGSVSTLLSTPRYVAPEVARTHRATAASDVFQLGIVLFELCTGTHPFALSAEAYGERALIGGALANLHGEVALGGVDDVGLRALIGAMLDRDPDHRPSAAVVATALSSRRG